MDVAPGDSVSSRLHNINSHYPIDVDELSSRSSGFNMDQCSANEDAFSKIADVYLDRFVMILDTLTSNKHGLHYFFLIASLVTLCHRFQSAEHGGHQRPARNPS